MRYFNSPDSPWRAGSGSDGLISILSVFQVRLQPCLDSRYTVNLDLTMYAQESRYTILLARDDGSSGAL
ncbi:hypothetical protein N7510_003771 [Penicillium lagena]|uniref:uncharacterized protein n=1 Tax=Penicillium lagena TaxID=94218 RepID=UPI0025407547|nr:uncharacterized protein N7510_003771 [Penicillium lagena]KAJ5619787.1 hypothetical protein N7510_003771 [Penicillium lagena]